MKSLRTLSCSVALLFSVMSATSFAALPGFLKMTNGYFYDNVTGKAFVPHGVAYQTWNRPLGVWQSWDQINYDLDEMVKMGANSIRVDFVWQHIEETGDNIFQWANYDYLVQQCELRNIRMFALIGYQWPPNWFPDSYYTMHPPETDASGIYHTNRWQSDIIGYETPGARAQYAEWISNVCARFKDSKAIAGWVVGNESGYLGLWSGLLDGYDTNCESAFRTYCVTKYATVAAANAAWGSSFTNFNQVKFVDQYRAYGVEGAIWADMVQWREDSIGGFTALGAKAAKNADTNHLISYSTVGMQWGEEDWRYHAEDRGKITAACLATNAPLDFFSVNNYPWSILGHESQNGHWGVSFTKKVAKVPVMYSETGFTSSETLWPGMNVDRQGPLIRNAIWESLEVGAIGTHVFSWMDRAYINDREKGFGIVYADRSIKPAYWAVRNEYDLMEQVNVSDLLMGSKDPTPDVAFLWTAANDSQYNRYECEMQQIAGSLERLGYEPNFIDLNDLGSGAYTNYKVIILPRNMRVEDVVPNSTNKTVLDFLRTVVIPKGIDVLASADIPGVQNFNGRPRTNSVNEIRSLFGVDPSDLGGSEGAARIRNFVFQFWRTISVKFTTNAVGSVSGGYAYKPQVWKYSDEVTLSTGGVLWATMDSGRNKGFEDSNTNIAPWSFFADSTSVPSSLGVRNNWGWQYSGSNMVQMYGDAVMWADADVVPFGRYTAGAYLRSNTDDPLRVGSYASVAIEWYGDSNKYLGVSESAPLATNTPGNAWVQYKVDDFAPSNTFRMRRVIRVGQTNIVQNPGLTGAGIAPTSWLSWNDTNHDPNAVTRLGTSGNSWQIFGDGGLYQDLTSGFSVGNTLKFGGWLYTPSADPIVNGTKYGAIGLEFYNGTNLISSTQAFPHVEWATQDDVWSNATGRAVVPAGTTKVRVYVRSFNVTNGTGRFFVDDLFVRNASSAGGSVYVDNQSQNPAVVVKNHGTGKSAIFLYSAGDNSPDSDGDGQPDTGPWKYRFDIFGAIIRDYFGIQPKLSCSGTNAFLCLPEYRTTSNNNVMIQMKNYLYNTNYANGGSNLNFVLTSSLLTGKTIRAFEQGKILALISSGTVTVSLPPDGQEILYAYPAPVGTSALPYVVQISDAPSVVHPFGDKVYTLKVKYDTVAQANMKLKIAFMENGDNGDGVSNEVYQILTNVVTGTGEQWYYMWIPDPNQKDKDYISTPDGGKYVFSAWMENPAGTKVAQAVPQPTALEWGVRPTNAVPTNIVKGQVVTMNTEWEDQYEQLFWQNTPLARETSFPSRVAVYRSTKTEAQFPGHLAKVNQVCDWLESLGYQAADPLDIGFDNVIVQGLFTNDFNSGVVSSWTRAAGAFNWGASAPTNGYLRAWRIGNDDNLLLGPTNNWGAITMSADVLYNKQDNYFDDIEIFPKYRDRNNYYMFGIRNFYDSWRIRFLVRVNGVIQQQGWLYDFAKTNHPVANVWYNLKVASAGSTNNVYFNNALVGTFYATNFPTARIALGTKASQLGIWEPKQGYFFIDDDENGFSADPNTNGPPLNMDWGYLNQFYRTLVLPGVYVMNNKEASNMVTWAVLGLNSVIATDGGIAMRNETGAAALGRVESLFGVGAAVSAVAGITKATLGTNDHYVTLDYAPGAVVAANGSGNPYTTLTRGLALATISPSAGSSPGLIVSTITNNPGAPGKTMVFNFGVDTSGQLTNGFKTLAKRAFEWARGQANKVRIELKYTVNATNPAGDLTIYATNVWMLNGSGQANVNVVIPSDGIMTGDKMYWDMYSYPWDATNAWLAHDGFYSSGNDNMFTVLPGKGLQILGATDKAFAGRDWDLFAAYNTRTTAVTMLFGIKEKGALSDEDNFNDGDYAGWSALPSTNIQWSVTSSSLQARVGSAAYGYSYIYRSGLNITSRNVTVEYDTLYTNGAYDGGFIYRGRVLYVNPNLCGWADNVPNYYTSNRPAASKWSHVLVNIRDGAPYLRSDLYVDGRVVFLDEPIETTTWTTNTIGFLSPYSNVNATVKWDNVRVADEQYSFVYTNVFGEYVPNSATNPTFWPTIPDYDPAMWEHAGTTKGQQYEWYVYARGEGFHSYLSVNVYFSPRLRVEATNFPTVLSAGTNVVVPIEWESLISTTVPARLRLRLFDAYSGIIYVEKTTTVFTVTGSTNMAVTIPTMPAGTNYVWATFLYATNAIDAWEGRYGVDDTFRFNESGVGVEPETMITMLAPPATGGVYNLYNDAGLAAGSQIFTWQGGTATFNGNNVDGTAPEGTMDFLTTGSSWQGWGVFKTNNMSAYAAGYLKFWAKSATSLEIDLETGSAGPKVANIIPSTTNLWKQFSLPISGFSGVVLTNVYGLFEVTAATPTTFYVDDVKWSLTP